MKTKTKLCDGCEKHKMIWKNHEGKRYCQYCWNVLNVTVSKTKTNKKPTKPIPRVSPSRAKEEREYTKLRLVFLEENPACKAKIPGHCTYHATDVHHKKGRGKYYLDVSLWLPACRACHDWIENHTPEAIALGLSISKTT